MKLMSMLFHDYSQLGVYMQHIRPRSGVGTVRRIRFCLINFANFRDGKNTSVVKWGFYGSEYCKFSFSCFEYMPVFTNTEFVIAKQVALPTLFWGNMNCSIRTAWICIGAITALSFIASVIPSTFHGNVHRHSNQPNSCAFP